MDAPTIHLATGLGITLASLILVWLGARGAGARKPLALRSRWLWLLVAACLAPLLMGALRASTGPLGLAVPALAVAVLAYAWFRMSDYWLLGVSEEPLRAALEEADASLEGSWPRLELLGGAEMRFSVQDRLGTGQVRVTGSSSGVAELLAKALQSPRFADSAPRRTASYLSLALGLGMLALGLVALLVPTESTGLALGFAGEEKSSAPSAISLMTMAAVGVGITSCDEHLVCLVALAALLGWGLLM